MADEAYCAACEAHFGSAETLARHQEAFHKPRAPAAPPTPTAEVNFDDGSNLEIAPLLAVLTEAQKDVLLMRAIARVPELADSLLQLVESPLTPEGAADRVAELRGDTGVSIVRAYAEIGSAANALCMLTALTEAVVGSLEELLDLLPTSTSTSATSSAATKRTSEERDSWETSDELRAVEAMPAAGTLSILWKEMLLNPKFLPLAMNDEIAELLNNAEVAASSVRKHAPAILLGTDGSAPDFNACVALLEPQVEQHGQKNKKKRVR